jgi:hypothetical protein
MNRPDSRVIARAAAPSRDTSLLHGVAFVAVVSMVAALLMPLLRVPVQLVAGIFLGGWIAAAALYALPLSLWGGVVGGMLAAVGHTDGTKAAKWAAGGIVLGGLLCFALPGRMLPTTLLLCPAIFGGLGLAMGLGSGTAHRVSLFLVMAIGFPIALSISTPTCFLSGGG